MHGHDVGAAWPSGTSAVYNVGSIHRRLGIFPLIAVSSSYNTNSFHHSQSVTDCVTLLGVEGDKFVNRSSQHHLIVICLKIANADCNLKIKSFIVVSMHVTVLCWLVWINIGRGSQASKFRAGNVQQHLILG